jgi:ribosome-associated protein
LTEIDSREKAVLLSRFALDRKAYDLVLLEVRELTSIADYFIVCSGRSDRQVQSIAQGIE